MEKVIRLFFCLLATLPFCGHAYASEDVLTAPFSIDASPEVLLITGTWFSDNEQSPPLLAKLNSADIKCSKQTMSCTEVVAILLSGEEDSLISGFMLAPIFNQYVVTSWTGSEITAKSEKRAADVMLKVNLERKSVQRLLQETKARGVEPADPTNIVEWTLK